MNCKCCGDKLQNYQELKKRGYCYKKQCDRRRKRYMNDKRANFRKEEF